MAKISDARPRNVSGAYQRLFNDDRMGLLISKVQSTVISAGSELERMIKDRVTQVPDLDSFLQRDIMPEGVFLATKQQIRRSVQLESGDSEPDFLVFKRRKNRQMCHIIELKDGHVFDTKKANAEHQTVHRFVELNGRNIPFVISTHFCAFNQEDRQLIWEGFKKRIRFDEAMTGREFCELLEIDYEEIVRLRQGDADSNLHYFLSELVAIPRARRLIEHLLK